MVWLLVYVLCGTAFAKLMLPSFIKGACPGNKMQHRIATVMGMAVFMATWPVWVGVGLVRWAKAGGKVCNHGKVATKTNKELLP